MIGTLDTNPGLPGLENANRDAHAAAAEVLAELEVLITNEPGSLLAPVVLDQMAWRVRSRRASLGSNPVNS